MRSERRGFLSYGLALGALLFATVVALFLLPVSPCPRCTPLRLYLGGNPKMTGCTPCDNSGKTTPFVAWICRGDGEWWKK